MITRRRFFALAGGVGALGALGAGSWAALKSVVSDEDYIVAVLRHSLRDVPYRQTDLRDFASAYKGFVSVRRKQRIAAVSETLYYSKAFRRIFPDQFDGIERMERMIFSEFILRTNFFAPDRDQAQPLTYTGYDGPIVCNPLARFREA